MDFFKIKIKFCFLFLLLCCSVQAASVTVLENSLESLEVILQCIDQAEYSVELSLCYTGGTVLEDILKALEKKLDSIPYFKVHCLCLKMMLDSKDEDLINSFENKYKDRFNFISLSTFLLCEDQSKREYVCDLHIKTIIVDEKICTVGGTNFEELMCTDGSYTPHVTNLKRKGCLGMSDRPSGMRDQDVLVRAKCVKNIRKIFFNLFALYEEGISSGKIQNNPDVFENRSRYFDVPKRQVKGFKLPYKYIEHTYHVQNSDLEVAYGCAYQKQNNIVSMMSETIDKAKHSIVIANAFFAPPKKVHNSLLKALNRDVSLEIITNGIYKDSPEFNKFFVWCSRGLYYEFMYGKYLGLFDLFFIDKYDVKNVSIFEYRVPDIVYHKKLMVIDEATTIIGSFNLGLRSEFGDYELVIKIKSEAVAKDILNIINRDQTLSQKVKVKDAYLWYFSPYYNYLTNISKCFLGLIV